MRTIVLLAALIISAPAIAADAGQPAKSTSPNCPQTSSYLAGKSGLHQGKPLTPQKLTELPPATTYMAVYRHIGGCEAPLTMVEYRNPRRR